MLKANPVLMFSQNVIFEKDSENLHRPFLYENFHGTWNTCSRNRRDGGCVNGIKGAGFSNHGSVFQNALSL